tara:strand:- start:638 stop:880 length:243 start_codon:yes stop_codon:yes gene_type:complete
MNNLIIEALKLAQLSKLAVDSGSASGLAAETAAALAEQTAHALWVASGNGDVSTSALVAEFLPDWDVFSAGKAAGIWGAP